MAQTKVAQRQLIQSAEGFVQGCKLEYLSTTAIRVTPGRVYIQSSGEVLTLSSNSDTSPSLSASTWYHVYLYDNAGTTAVEVSTTAPASPWMGTAKSKTGDTSRRYLGSFKTNSSSEIMNFHYQGSGNLINVTWRLETATKTRALAAGTANVNTAVDLSPYVPVGTRQVRIRCFSNANVGCRIDSDDMTGTNPSGGQGHVALSAAGGDVYPEHPINVSQQIRYSFLAAPTTGGLYVDVYGYWLER